MANKFRDLDEYNPSVVGEKVKKKVYTVAEAKEKEKADAAKKKKAPAKGKK